MVLVAWPEGVQDSGAHALPKLPKPVAVGTLGLETNQGPFPQPAAGRARSAHARPVVLYHCPQTTVFFKYARRARAARPFPAALSLHLTSLRCLCAAAPTAAVILERLLSARAPYPALLPVLVVAFRLKRPEHHLMHACRRPD